MTAATRGTIFLEKARVISQLAYDAEQFVLRVAAPKCAAHAQPGSFAHLTCDATIPMRRPPPATFSKRMVTFPSTCFNPRLMASVKRRIPTCGEDPSEYAPGWITR